MTVSKYTKRLRITSLLSSTHAIIMHGRKKKKSKSEMVTRFKEQRTASDALNFEGVVGYYGDVWEKAVSKLMAEDRNEIPMVETFESVLKPLYWVDWRDADLLDAYHGSGEVPRTALRVWMKAAIKNGDLIRTNKSCRELSNLNLARILSPPEDSPIINSTPEKKWPTSDVGGELILTSVRPGML